MASWLMLGGLLPMAFDVLTQRHQSISLAGFLVPERQPYAGEIAIGIASLCVRRCGTPWRLIVAAGMAVFLAAAGLQFRDTGPAGVVWPLAMCLLIFLQYRRDMKAAPPAVAKGE